MIIQKPYVLFLLSFLVSCLLIMFGNSYSVSVAQNDLTPTPESTRIPFDSDLFEEFENALQYETGPGFTEDEACELPCWWGMTPGITPEEEVIRILENTSFYRNWNQTEPFDSTEGEIGGAITLDLVSGVRSDFYILFVADQGVLDHIEMDIREPNFWLPSDRFDLATVLTEFDSTPVIYVNPNRLLTVMLIYEKEGFIFSYWYDYLRSEKRYETSEDGYVKSVSMCSDDEIVERIIIELKNPNGKEPIGQEIYEGPFLDPIEEMTDIDSETFVDFFRENPEKCLEITLEEPDEDKN